MLFSLRLIIPLLICIVIAPTSVADSIADDREAQMRAAYVFNFVKFVEWPSRTLADAIQVCFSGAPRVRDAFSVATANKEVGGRHILVRSLEANPPDARCDVVYIDGESPAEKVLPAAAAFALTIGDDKSFTREGGVIQLYTESNRLRFVVNVDNAKRAGLQVSSHLLKLATRVEQEGAL